MLPRQHPRNDQICERSSTSCIKLCQEEGISEIREIGVCLRTFSDLSTPLHFLIARNIGALCFPSQLGVPDHFLVTSRQTPIRFCLSYISGAKRARLGRRFSMHD